MKLVLLFLLTGLTVIALPAKSQTSPFNVNPGDQLIYKVNYNGDIYNFEVTLISIGEKGIIFSYNMPERNKAAKIEISRDAMSNAAELYNYFNGKDQLLTEQISVWLSRKSFKDLNEGKTLMDAGDGIQAFNKQEDLTYTFSSNGKKTSVAGFRIDNGMSETAHRQLWVLNNQANPLILKMDLGWTIELIEVKPAL